MSDNAANDRQILDLLESAVDRGVFSGAQIEVGTLGGAMLSEGVGSTANFNEVSLSERVGGANHRAAADDIAQSVTRATLFDVASVTKAVVTSILCMRAVQLGRLSLEEPIGPLLPDRLQVDPGLADVPLEQLLRHRSGLDAWHPFYENVGPDEVATAAGQELIRARVARHGVRPEQGEVYSDLGYILLDVILEEALGLPLTCSSSSTWLSRWDWKRVSLWRWPGALSRWRVQQPRKWWIGAMVWFAG